MWYPCLSCVRSQCLRNWSFKAGFFQREIRLSYQNRLPMVAPMPTTQVSKYSSMYRPRNPKAYADKTKWCRRKVRARLSRGRSRHTEGNGQVSDKALLEHLRSDVSESSGLNKRSRTMEPCGDVHR